jgi:ATP-dependent Clp protease ATP-binding subunit ClpA
MDTIELDPTVMLIWRMSSREAALSGCAEVLPIHVYLALLSAINGINPFGTDLDAAEETAWNQIQQQQAQALQILGKDDKAAVTERRSLIRQLHHENPLWGDNKLERSEAVVRLFDQAVNQAKSKNAGAATFLDLLEAIKPLVVEDEIARVKESVKQAAETVKPADAQPVPTPRVKPESAAAPSNGLGVDLTQLALAGSLTERVIREPETKALARILLKTKKGNALLIGQSGVGKTAIVEGLAQWLISDAAPAELRNLHIVQVNAIDLFANTSYRGQLEQRMIDLLNQLKASAPVILFIDNFHIITTPLTSQSFQALSDILQTALDSGDIRCIGVTTIDEYERYLQADKAFMRRFELLTIMEPDNDTSGQICRLHANRLAGEKKVQISDEVVSQAVELSSRYLPGRYQPDKCIDLIENAAANCRLNQADESHRAIVVNDLWRVLAEQYGVTQRKIDKDSSAYSDLEVTLAHLPSEKAKIIDFMGTLSARPGNSGCHGLLLYGSPEVGLAHLAKSIGDCLSGGTTENICSLDLREFLDPQGILRLFGDLHGSGGAANGVLEKQIRSYPNSVYILEHFETAHPVIQQRITQLIEDGSIRDSNGDVSYFQNSVFLLLYETERETLTRRGKKKLSDEEKKEVMEFSLMDMIGQSGDGIFKLVTLVYIYLPDLDDLTLIFDRLFAVLRADIYKEKKVSLRVGDVDKANILSYLADHTINVYTFLSAFSVEIYQPVTHYIQEHSGQTVLRLAWDGAEIQVLDQSVEKSG